MSSFADVQEIVARRHGVPERGRRALLSRLRHLNAADFPPGTRVGRQRRADYRIDDLFAFALWFALAEAFVPPTVAQRMIRDLWPELVRGMLSAAAAIPQVGNLPLNGSCGAVAAISPYALDFVDGGPRGTGRGAVGAGSWEVALVDVVTGLPASRGAVLMIDLRREVEAILIPNGSVDAIEPSHLRELHVVAAEQGWAEPSESALPVAEVGARLMSSTPRMPDPAGDRFGVADHLFARAIEVLRSRLAAGERWVPTMRDERHLQYIATPFQREGWKRFLSVQNTPFLWALWAALDSDEWKAPMPETMTVAVKGRFKDHVLIEEVIRAAEHARSEGPCVDPS